MNILFDIVHPAHVHFFRHMISRLQEMGHKTLVVARDKDVTTSLLDAYGVDYLVTGKAGNKSRAGQLLELVQRVAFLVREGKRFGADIILTRNPAGVQAARILGCTGVFDTDDGLAAGIHFKAAAPFADVITTPDCFTEDYGPKHIKYPGYKQSAYLHSDLFQPNPEVLDMLGVKENETWFLVRFVSMTASHDKGETGLRQETKQAIIERLSKHGRVFISCEGELPEQWAHLKFNVPSHLMHDALYYTSMLVGDSQTMAAEAAVLGTLNLRISSFAKRITYLNELENKYQLTKAYLPQQHNEILLYLEKLLLRNHSISDSRKIMETEKNNITEWFVEKIIFNHSHDKSS